VYLLLASFTCNNYCCTEAKPAESRTSLKQSKWIQKNHKQSKLIIQSADTKLHVTKNVTKSYEMLWHDQIRC